MNMLLVLFLLVGASTASNPVEEFLSPEHNKTGVVWLHQYVMGNGDQVLACEENAVKRYLPFNVIDVEKDIYDDLQCIPHLINRVVNCESICPTFDWDCQAKCFLDTTIPIRKLTRGKVEKKVLKEVEETNVPALVFCNDGDDIKYGQTPPMNLSRTRTIEWTIPTKAKISSRGKISIPLVSSKKRVEFEFSGNSSYGENYGETQKIQRDSQRVEVPPRTCVEAKLVFRRIKTLYKYPVDFEVDDGQEDVISRRYWWLRTKAVVNDTSDIRELHLYNNQTGVSLELHGDGDRVILHHVPVEETDTTTRYTLRFNVVPVEDSKKFKEDQITKLH